LIKFIRRERAMIFGRGDVRNVVALAHDLLQLAGVTGVAQGIELRRYFTVAVTVTVFMLVHPTLQIVPSGRRAVVSAEVST
jgi:hypothetical protein